MTQGLLLDTHVLLWLDTGAYIEDRALREIDRSSRNRSLFTSHISIWELGVAQGKKQVAHRPDLRGLTPAIWVNGVMERFTIKQLSLSVRVASEAALVPAVYGSGDPGDCFLIATARVRNLALVTRDRNVIALGKRRPEYLTVLAC